MSVDGDPFHLQRFVDAQLRVITDVRQELAAGRKRTHWMWFVFPQIAGLGRSEIAARYAIGSAEEARAYLAHPVLRERLLECVELVCRHSARSAYEIFGTPDDLKFRSSLTLFGAVSEEPLFGRALSIFFADAGQDDHTLRLLDKMSPA